jgi:hypothetical protein
LCVISGIGDLQLTIDLYVEVIDRVSFCKYGLLVCCSNDFACRENIENLLLVGCNEFDGARDVWHAFGEMLEDKFQVVTIDLFGFVN